MNENSVKKINVMHLASNPEWAGAEVQMATLVDSMRNDDRVEVSVTVFHNGKLVDYLRGRGVDVNVIGLKWLFDITGVTRLVRLLKNKRIDILHTNGYKANVIGALAVLIARRGICVRTEHGSTEPFSGINKLKMNIYESLDYLTGRFFTKKIISVSSDIKKRISGKYRPEMLITIPNGIAIDPGSRTDSNKLKEEFGIPEGNFIIGIIGRLVPVKGHEYFIEAAKLISQKRRDVNFLIVGGGPLKRKLESMISGEMSERIKFTGFRNDVKDIIGIMDLVVFSSLNEGLPYALLEAMAAGKAVIATKVGGLAEVISDEKNGYLVKSRDAGEIARKCLYLLEDTARIRLAGEEAKKTVREYFSVDHMEEETVRVYEEVLK
jgi:glycosyltransferase involved in cell wall biosynthesis